MSASETPRTDFVIDGVVGQHLSEQVNDLTHYMELVGVIAEHAREQEKELTAANAKLAEQSVRLRETEMDAERYRWMRSWIGRMDELAKLNLPEPETPEEADAYIDAARGGK
jgi:hypothetical protein